MSLHDLIIVGAGPSGLSAAIAAKRKNLEYHVLEQGVLVNSIARFPPHMVFFTTPELLEIGGLPFVSPYDKPTKIEALRYYRRVVDAFGLQVAFGEKVLAIEREGAGGAGRAGEADGACGAGEAGRAGGDEGLFAIETQSNRGVRRVRHARHVVMAIGYYDHPNMLGLPGEDLPHVHHYYREPHPYYRQRVVIVGGGNSAAEAALELYRAGAHVTLVHRGPELKSTIKYWVRPDIENRIREGSVAARFNSQLTAIQPTTVTIGAGGSGGAGAGEAGEAGAAQEEIPADAVFLLTGYRADTDLMVRAGVHLTERQGPHYDPQTFETNVPGLFVAGGAVAGVDTGTVFIENGRFHGERIIEIIAGRLEGSTGA